MKVLTHGLLAAALVFVLASSARADLIYNGPDAGPGGAPGWGGTDVWFGGVSESNTVGPGGSDAMLFGPPTSVTGNSIDFNPTNFEASVQAPPTGFATEIVDSQLSFTVVAKPGRRINELILNESGDTTIAALPTSLLTESSVTTFIMIDVIELDGAAPSQPINISATMTFSPSGGSYSNAADGGQSYDANGAAAIFATDWVGVAEVDFVAELASRGIDFDFGVTEIDVTLDNTLTVTAQNGESSFIKKKDFDGLTVTSVIPEPTTLALLALAAAGVASRRR